MGARPDKMTNTTGVKFLLQLGVNVFYNRADSISAQKKFLREDKFGAKKILEQRKVLEQRKTRLLGQAGFFIDVNGDEKFF